MRKRFEKVTSILLAAILVISMVQFGQVVKAADVTEPTNTVAVNDIPVVLYHRIVESPTNEWTDTSISDFINQMDYLQKNGYTTLSSEEYVEILQGNETPPEKPILLTFDDATPDFVTTALPILEERGMKCVLFVITGWIGGGYSMSEEELKDIADNHPNVSIENHTKSHEGWKDITMYEEALEEVTAANSYLKSITGKDPVLLAYPNGASSVASKKAAADAGIQYAFKVGYPNDGAYNMGRHYITNTSVVKFAEIIGGPVPTTEKIVEVYHETFEEFEEDRVLKSGNPTITHVTDLIFEGNDDGKAIYVSERNDSYDGIDFLFEDIGLENGGTYTVTVTGFVYDYEEVDSGGQVVLSTVSSDGKKVDWLSNVDLVAGEVFELNSEFTVDTSLHNRLRIQSDDNGAAVPFCIGDILITQKQEVPIEEEPEHETPGVEVYHETFTNGQGKAVRAGEPEITHVTDIVFEGNDDGTALYISKRKNDYDGIDFKFEEIGLKNGETYTVTVIGYVDEDAEIPEGAQAVLLTVNNYQWLSTVDYVAGQTFKLTKEFTVDTSKAIALRVQSNEKGKEVHSI